jgi:Rad3-related DNA helicase
VNPSDIGITKFETFRPAQYPAVATIMGSSKGVVALMMPTGTGKSLAYISGCLMENPDNRVCVLTKTKALQDQLMADFGELDIVDVRGRANYLCALTKAPADNAPCTHGLQCPVLSSCPYKMAIAAAKRAQVVVTNYAYWIHANRLGPNNTPIGGFDWLVMDEAHEAPIVLAEHLTARVGGEELQELLEIRFPGEATELANVPVERWQTWLSVALTAASNRLSRFQGRDLTTDEAREAAPYVSIARRLQRLKDACLDAAWDVWYHDKVLTAAVLGPVDKYVPRMLVGPADRVVLSSATLSDWSISALGMQDCEPVEVASPFDKGRCPIYGVPGERIKFSSSAETIDKWVEVMDQLIDARMDRRGVIHCHSYRWQSEIYKRSRHAGVMFAPRSSGTKSALATFLQAPPPSVFVSPAVATGVDLRYDRCEYQIIAKVPFPNTGDDLVKRQMKAYPGMSNHLTAQAIVQACGRGMRAVDDRCETFIVDDNIRWFHRNALRYFPHGFRINWRRQLPEPPPAINYT